MSEQCLDTYFLNSQEALKTALQNNRASTSNPTVDGLQICYYDGQKLPNAPLNCINVPLGQIVKYFSTTRNRIPQYVNFDNSSYLTNRQKEEFLCFFIDALSKAEDKRLKKTIYYHNKIKKLTPNFKDRPLRVFVPACRETTAMQYASEDIANTFKQMGYEVLFFNAKNEMQSCSKLASLKALYKFNPHITININHLNNFFLNDKVFNFVWFQDFMPILRDDKPIKLRKRDYIFSYQTIFTKALLKNRVPAKKIMKYQRFCINTDKFFLDKTVKKENKIIFVGSYYERRYPQLIDDIIHQEFRQMVTNGISLSKDNINKVFVKYNKSLPDDFVMDYIQHSYIRNMTVEWICQNPNIKAEIYGYLWDKSNNKDIIKRYKGPASKDKLNYLYNSAKYVLSSSGQVINTQRLGEAVHSGAIPVIYDSRDITDEKYTWDKECLYFKTQKELDYILENSINPKKYRSKKMLKYFTYRSFVKKVIKKVEKGLK